MARYFSSTQSVKRMKLGTSATRRSRGIMPARLRRAVAQGVSLAGGRLCTMSTAKEELTRLIQRQPDESSREEIVRELAFHVMVERGLADSDAKRTVSNEEMGRRIRAWPK